MDFPPGVDAAHGEFSRSLRFIDFILPPNNCLFYTLMCEIKPGIHKKRRFVQSEHSFTIFKDIC